MPQKDAIADATAKIELVMYEADFGILNTKIDRIAELAVHAGESVGVLNVVTYSLERIRGLINDIQTTLKEAQIRQLPPGTRIAKISTSTGHGRG